MIKTHTFMIRESVRELLHEGIEFGKVFKKTIDKSS